MWGSQGQSGSRWEGGGGGRGGGGPHPPPPPPAAPSPRWTAWVGGRVGGHTTHAVDREHLAAIMAVRFGWQCGLGDDRSTVLPSQADCNQGLSAAVVVITEGVRGAAASLPLTPVLPGVPPLGPGGWQVAMAHACHEHGTLYSGKKHKRLRLKPSYLRFRVLCFKAG